MTRFLVATFAAVIAFAAVSASSPSNAAQKVRVLRQNDQPIVSRLLPDDQVVVIEDSMGPPRPSPFKKTREVELRDLASWEEVAVVHQAKSRSFLVMNETWLNTIVHARVMQTLKTGRLQTAPGSVIEFEHEGGELNVNGVIVRSAVGVSFEENSRYLIAVRFHPDLKKWQVGVMFELDNLNALHGSKRRSGQMPDSALFGLSLADVAAAISKGAK